MYCSPIFVDEKCTISFKSDSLIEQDLQLMFLANDTDLPHNCIYKTIIETTNNADKINSTGNISIST